MSQLNRTSKRGNLSSDFMNKAQANPEGALATMFMASFGVDLGTIIYLMEKMVEAKDSKIMLMCITASVQIRAHVVFVGRDFANIRVLYPELIIEGDREQGDIFNFSAMHALGHALCHATSSAFGPKVFAKAGSCITGEGCPETDAGKINREVANGWSATDKAAFGNWINNYKASKDTAVDQVFNSLTTLKDSFKGGKTSVKASAPSVVPKPPSST